MSNVVSESSPPITPYPLLHLNVEARRLLLDLEREFYSFVTLSHTHSLRAVLAAYVANKLPSDPVWLLLIAPPSSGKTEILGLLRDVEDCHEVSTFTQGSLISGTSRKEKAKGATGGLLIKIGEFGVMVCKDFTSVLSMNRDTLNGAMAILREAHDGRVSRILGTDGGKEVVWAGKLGVLGGVTQKIDSHHEVLSAMGERFLMCRMKASLEDAFNQARYSLNRVLNPEERRASLREKTQALLEAAEPNLEGMPELPKELCEKILNLSIFIAHGRTPVERDYQRKVDRIFSPEGPSRIAQQLRALYTGLLLIGCAPEEAWDTLQQVAFSSFPELRWEALSYIRDNPCCTLDSIVKATRYPKATMRKHACPIISQRGITG